MKQFYLSTLVLLLFAGSLSAQNFYWIGPSNGSWDNTANWSNTSGGPSAGAYPQNTTDNVILNANASIQLNTTVSINSISVTGTNTSVVITAVGGGIKTITVNSTNAASPGLSIAATCRLENSAISGSEFIFRFVVNGQGAVNGDWYFTGDIDLNNFAYYELPLSGAGTALNINNGGSITIGSKAFIAPNETTGDDFLIFNAGASLNLLGNGPIIPVANYNAASIINITGVTNATVVFEESGSVGTINYNCPGQSNGTNPLYLSLLTFSVEGNLNILNTNNNELTLISYSSTVALPSRDAVIRGNLNIQGTSIVAIAHNDGPEIPNNLTVYGNVIANGTGLRIHSGPFVTNQPTRLIVKGNIQHTAGIFSSTSAAINETTDLFIIEMNGTVNQTISSTGTFDNAGHQVTLRMNNAAGVTLLSSLEIGRLDFNTANKGKITTNANILTINNTDPASVSSLVVNSPSNLGFVDGTVRRKTASTEPVILPTGAGTVYRPTTIIPSSSSPSTFQAKYFNTGYSDLSVQLPLLGVSPDYYWDIARVGSGANAAIQLNIPGAVTGSQPSYGLVVAKYTSSEWLSVLGSTGTMVTPGDATSGIVTSEMQTTFGPYTIGFGAQSSLPTLLISFDAKKTSKETVVLTWKITENSTPSVFEVMRSADGINFNRIGSLSGIEGTLAYRFTDNAILNGNNYYRLRMVDKDGSVTYSTIVIVSNGSKGIFMNSLAPTLVRDRTKLNISSSANANLQLVITDMNGRIVRRQVVSLTNGSQDIWIDATSLPVGMFHVSGYVNGEKTATLRFIKL